MALMILVPANQMASLNTSIWKYDVEEVTFYHDLENASQIRTLLIYWQQLFSETISI